MCQAKECPLLKGPVALMAIVSNQPALGRNLGDEDSQIDTWAHLSRKEQLSTYCFLHTRALERLIHELPGHHSAGLILFILVTTPGEGGDCGILLEPNISE
jgi:hypothetical protein